MNFGDYVYGALFGHCPACFSLGNLGDLLRRLRPVGLGTNKGPPGAVLVSEPMIRFCMACKKQTEQTLEPYSPGMKQWYCHEHGGAAWISANVS